MTVELDGENTVQSGLGRAGVEKNDGNSSGNLTITDENETHGSLNATGGEGGAGIGGGGAGSGSDITISGSAKVTAQGGKDGSGIGGGYKGSGSNITISQDAQVKAQGGKSKSNSEVVYGAGAAIGNGGKPGYPNSGNLNGAEATPNTDELTPNGKIEYYAPDADMKNNDPIKTVTGTYVPPQPTEPEEEAPQTAALYRVIGQDGKDLSYKAARQDGVLTITVDADFAILIGSLSGMKTLKAQGVDAVVFVTNGASSTFAIANLLAQGSYADTYNLTHDGTAVTFTLNNGADINKTCNNINSPRFRTQPNRGLHFFIRLRWRELKAFPCLLFNAFGIFFQHIKQAVRIVIPIFIIDDGQ